MSYCTVSDVEVYFLGKKFDCDTHITSDQVQSLIYSEAAMIDLKLKNRYTLPITNQSDLIILKVINEKLVAGIIDATERTAVKDQKFTRSRDLKSEAMDVLSDIYKGNLKLNTTGKASAIKFNNVDSKGNTVEKRFKVSNIPSTTERVDRERRTIIVSGS